MPEFQMNTAGAVALRNPPTGPTLGPATFSPVTFRMLPALTQGYLKALFFTSEEDLGELGFSSLSGDALDAISADCAKFAADNAEALEEAQETPGYGPDEERGPCDDEHAGRDFWYTRNGHGCGFWDGDWPQPQASTLTAAAEAFRGVEPYVGEDGLIYLD